MKTAIEQGKMLDATGDVVAGDTIKFTEGVFGGAFRRPKYVGARTICARVLKESYGASTAQHTFTLSVISSTGFEPLQVGKQIRRKGRNVYRNGTLRELWKNEDDRDLVAEEKHTRGRIARDWRKHERF